MNNLTGKTLLGRYFLRELVGSGGMADVYKVWDNLRSSEMAVKVLRRDLANSPRTFQMFAKEAEVLRRLEHPSIVRLYEFEREGDVVFIIMDWVEGGNLKDHLKTRRNPYSLEETSRLLFPISNALNYAHQNNVFHCDVKPANILLHKDGQVLLTDFGVANLPSESGGGGGTPPYMAPEQFSKGVIDARTDVYALGITLYEILSGGNVPFQGRNPNSQGSTLKDRIAWEHLNSPIPSLKTFGVQLPEAVQNVLMTALSKNPAHRYPSTMALREAFEHARTNNGRGGSNAGTILLGDQATFNPAAPLKQIRKMDQRPPSQKIQSPGRPFLLGRSGERAGQVLVIPDSGLTIGRSSENGLKLTEPAVSRKHAGIAIASQGVYIYDLNSALGTYVNGQKLQGSLWLKHGDVIQIGYQQVFEYRQK